MNKAFKLLLAVAPILLVSACGGGDDSVDDRLDIADPKVRFVDAAELSPNMSLYRDGVAQSSATNVGYKGATDYFTTSTGSSNWRVATTTGDVTVGNTSFDAGRGGKYTLIAVPDLNFTGAEVLFISDPYDKELTANNARARVLNAAANAGSIDVYLVRTGTDIATVPPTFPAVGYKTANPESGANSVDVTVGPGTFTLTITPVNSKTPIFVAPVTVANNADWLLTVLPKSPTPNDLKVLLVNSNDVPITMEIGNTL